VFSLDRVTEFLLLDDLKVWEDEEEEDTAMVNEKV
jgi:hypothetical protein